MKNKIFKHVKTNKYYLVLEIAFLEKDMSKVIVYKSYDNDMVFVRPEKEFLERFILVEL